jgi:1-acyl-sn-glycerol-3-phosphate acyltransferase
MEDDRFVLRSITDEIMYELMLLSGQEYVDEYATSMKDRLVRAAKARAREIQEAARPGSAAKELEDALDAAEGIDEDEDDRIAPLVDDPVADWAPVEDPKKNDERAAS